MVTKIFGFVTAILIGVTATKSGTAVTNRRHNLYSTQCIITQ